MKLITDNAFDKAWKKSCPTCEPQQVNRILWFREQCHTCETLPNTKEHFYKYGASLGIKINDLQRLKMLATKNN
jgi:hypothetical protein